jgi:hypothetical protein
VLVEAVLAAPVETQVQVSVEMVEAVRHLL